MPSFYGRWSERAAVEITESELVQEIGLSFGTVRDEALLHRFCGEVLTARVEERERKATLV